MDALHSCSGCHRGTLAPSSGDRHPPHGLAVPSRVRVGTARRPGAQSGSLRRGDRPSQERARGPLWDSIVARYGLHATPYEQIANWSFVDWMLNFSEEVILSTIKIRKAGFADCIDTHESFRRQLTQLRELRVIP